MSDAVLDQIREVIQRDVNNRGLARDPNENLFTACRDDFANACRSIADHPHPSLAIVTGFYIPHADRPCGESDGPLGAIFLARAAQALGIEVELLADDFCRQALKIGLQTCGLDTTVPVLPAESLTEPQLKQSLRLPLLELGLVKGFLIALERAGPGHDGRCRNMHGREVDKEMAPAHLFFEDAAPLLTTIGIGDGGNEIGMGKIPPEVIARNVPHGEQIACRVPTDHLIVAGVSNWGAYALAAGVAVLQRQPLPASLFDPERERELLRIMVEQGPLVDGVTAKQTVTVDGLTFDDYAEPLRRIGELLEKEQCLTYEERPGPK
jgi:D-glutamate cyclase